MKPLPIAKFTMALGVAFLIGSAAFVVHKRKFLAEAEQVEGIILSDGDCPEVGYIDRNGDKHRFTLNSCQSPPAYRLRQIVKVWIDRNDPRDLEVEGFFSLWGLAFITGIIGVIALVIGVPFYLKLRRMESDQDLARRSGERIAARITSVKLDPFRVENELSPYSIVSQQQIDGKVYTFVSEDIWYDPAEFIKGDTIDVYYVKGDPTKYFVDISFLPEKG